MRTSVKFDNTELTIGTMFCIGQNYADHIKEMGNVELAEPLIFIKPSQAYAENNSNLNIPDFTDNMHYEVELVAIIGKHAKDVTSEDALNYVAGYTVGIDLTLRDKQQLAKKQGTPWAVAKGFAKSAPMADFVSTSKVNDPQNLGLELYLNDEMRQKSNTIKMQRTTAELISYLSHIFELLPGDIVFTGTPEGVGKISNGDKITAYLKQDDVVLTELTVFFK